MALIITTTTTTTTTTKTIIIIIASIIMVEFVTELIIMAIEPTTITVVIQRLITSKVKVHLALTCNHTITW